MDYGPECLVVNEPLIFYVRPYSNDSALVENSSLYIRYPGTGDDDFIQYAAPNGTYIIPHITAGIYIAYAVKEGWVDSDVRYVTCCCMCSTTTTSTTSTSTTTTTIKKLSIDYTPENPTLATLIILYVRPYGSTTELVEESYVNIRGPSEGGYTSYEATNGTYTIQTECGVYGVYATKENWTDSDTVYITACACCTTTSTSTTI